jgi:diguanylate cyclase (GGDEF)-like protein/PAS domain S-box-containing protein
MMKMPPAMLVPRPLFLRIVGAGMLATLLVSVLYVAIQLRGAESVFTREASDYYDLVSQRMHGNQAVLSGLVALHHAVEEADYDQLSLYAGEMLSSYPHIYSVEYLVRVARADRQAFEQGMRDRGFADFRIWHSGRAGHAPSPENDFYFPTVFVEPFDPVHVQVLGQDAYAVPVLRKALVHAIEDGAAAASGPVQLTGGERGYVVFQAVYSGRRVPASVEERRRQAMQVVAVVVSARRLLAPAHPLGPHVQVRLIPAGASQDDAAAGFQLGDAVDRASLLSSFRYQRRMDEAGEPFVLRLSEQPGWDLVHPTGLLVVVAMGVLVTGLVLQIVNIRSRSALARQQAREAIYRERERAEVTLYSIADAVITTDTEGRVEFLNPVAERLLGWRARDARGQRVDEVLTVTDESSGEAIANPVPRCLRDGGIVKLAGDLSLSNRSGRKYPITVSVAPIRDFDGTIIGTALVLQDVSQARDMARRLSYQATHDDLTGLYSRREFERRVSAAIDRASGDGGHAVLCYMDLDQFKVVNDTCGHIAGDSMLKQIAAVLQPHAGEHDTLARLGGDEFGMLLEECTLPDAVVTVEELINAVKRFRFEWEGKTFETAVSVGLVPITPDYRSLTEVMSFADSACYLAKEKGGNRYHVYKADDDALIRRQGEMEWVHRITQAYSDKRFVLYAQEIVPLHGDGRGPQHYEILLRMLDEGGDLVLPMEYIRAAERYNMMSDLDRWVVYNAFALINDYLLRRQADPSLPVKRFAINLSGQSLGNERTRDFVAEQFERYPDLPEAVIFEITETAAVSNLAQAEQFISAFRQLGCSFSLDDFGTGFSSFAHLKHLTVDYLKIDGAFVREMDYDPVDFAMVGSINHIGHVIGIRTIAEYV